MKVIRFRGEEKYWSEKFLDLPAEIYKKEELTNNKKEEIELLRGNHCLSKGFEIQAFLVVDEEDKPLSRCVVTIYPKKEELFLGLFESLEIREAARLLFLTVDNYCKEIGRNKIIGPVDGSFWIKYRLKIDNFGKPYTGEPYNKEYYYFMFQDAGYKVFEEYISNKYMAIPKGHHNPILKRRLRESERKGYEIRSPKKEEFSKVLDEIGDLILELYKEFPIFSDIKKSDFIKMFSKLKPVLDFSMIKLAYFKGDLVAFSITIPNYGGVINGKLNLLKILKLMKIRKKAKEYVLLYLGAKEGHLGLGAALVQKTSDELEKRGAKSIGALIQKNKVTETYFNEIIEKKEKYVLLEKRLVGDLQIIN